MTDELARLRSEYDVLRIALTLLADPENWLGDPLSHEAALFGHFTPHEVAVTALADCEA